MTHHQMLAAWVLFGAGFVACSVVILIVGVIAMAQEGRRGGARAGRSRPDAGCRDGRCRRGEGSPRRVYDDAAMNAFLTGSITINELMRHHNGRSE